MDAPAESLASALSAVLDASGYWHRAWLAVKNPASMGASHFTTEQLYNRAYMRKANLVTAIGGAKKAIGLAKPSLRFALKEDEAAKWTMELADQLADFLAAILQRGEGLALSYDLDEWEGRFHEHRRRLNTWIESGLTSAPVNATVADITAPNRVNIDPGAIADLVLKRLAEQQTVPAVAAPTGREALQEAGAGANWREVQERLLRLRNAGEQSTSRRQLAKQLSCSVATIQKAIDNSASLKGWAARAKAPPKAQSLNEVTTGSKPSQREPDPADALLQDEGERVMGLLIDQATPKERAELNALSIGRRRELVRAYREQQADKHTEDKARKGNRILGRKP